MGLSDAAIRKLKPKSDRYEVTDQDGLYIEVHPSGRLVWRYRYRLNGKREKYSIGPYPAIGLHDARAKRLAAERLVLEGKSPAQFKQVERKALKAGSGKKIRTFSDLSSAWIANVLKAANKNARQDENYLERDIEPRIGDMTLDSIATTDVWGCIEPLVKRGHGQAARRVRSVIKRVFEYGQSLGLVKANPALIVRPTHIAPTRARTRTMSSDELRTWLSAVYTSRLSRIQKLALHFLMLIPARKGELIKARWRDFDLDGGTWDIPRENSKNGIPIRHKLSRQALAVISELREVSLSEWVLASSRGVGQKPISTSSLNTALRQVKGLPADTVIHDLRRTIRTGLSDLGVSTEVAELCLNHRPAGVQGVYDRAERLEQRAIALQRWADHVDGIQASANVVPIGKRPTQAA